MNTLRRIVLRLRAIVARASLENDMQSEMREHLDRATERFVARGMSQSDARLAARREFGNATTIQEDARDARGARWVDEVKGDLRFAFRYFARHKATTAIIVVVLALGTGANTMIFSVFQAEFLRPAPGISEDGTHVRVWAMQRATQTARWEPRLFSQPEMLALAARREVFSDVAAWKPDDVVLDAGDSTGALSVGAQFVTPNFFRALGVRLAAGQSFANDANGPDMAAVMSYGAAERLYGNAIAAVGRRVLVNELPLRVVGVAPQHFQGALRNMDKPSIWIPLSARADIARAPARWITDEASLAVFGRMTPNASREQANTLARLVVANALPDSASRVGMARTAHVLEMNALPPGAESNEALLVATMVMAIGIIILLVAWMNVSSLMVAAAVGRRHEIAVRLSLGASRTRVLRQLITESTLLALVGGAAGLMLSWWVLAFQQKAEVDGVDMMPDWVTFAFVLGLALVTGILFGLSPALHATRDGVANALRDSGTASTSRSRLQRTFVAVQIMLSQPLLVILGVLLSLVIADYQPLSPEMSKHVVSVQFRPLATGAPGQRPEAVDALLPRIAQRPEVQSAVPNSDAFEIRGVFVPDRRQRDAQSDTVPTIVHLEGAAPGWFALVDVPIILGRDVSLADTAAANHPVVIGSDFARTLWGDANPIGRTLPAPPLQGFKQDSIAMTVVGVYDATSRLPGVSWGGQGTRGSMSASLTRVFTAHGKHWQRAGILVRTRGPAEPFLPELQRFVRAAAPSLPVASMLTFAQMDANAYRDTLRAAMLAGAGGALALLLASLGLYGVVSLAVQQRTREIGIRIAVGANPSGVARMFLASGVRVGVIALVLGLPLSIFGLKVALARGIMIAPGVNAYLVGAGIAAVLLVVAAAATWVPAHRASLVDPATTLRVE